MLSHLAREARLGGVLATQGWFWGWLQGRVGRCLRPGAALVLPAWHRPGRSRLLTSLEPPVPEAMMCPEGAGVRHGSVTGQLWAPRSSAEPASSGSSAAPVLGRGDFPSQKQRLISRGKLRGKKNGAKQLLRGVPRATVLLCSSALGDRVEAGAGGLPRGQEVPTDGAVPPRGPWRAGGRGAVVLVVVRSERGRSLPRGVLWEGTARGCARPPPHWGGRRGPRPPEGCNNIPVSSWRFLWLS